MIDAERRDLTVNSMFLDLSGTVYDYFNGKEDLEKKRVAFVGTADARIKEDYLRIFRYFRFYGRLAKDEDNHETETINAIIANKEGLGKISGERIWTEWKKILSNQMGGPLTLKMIEIGLGPFMGLPQETLNERFRKFWSTKCQKTHYMNSLTQLLKNQDDMMKLHARLKMSGYERDMGLFLLQNRDIPADLKHWQKVYLLSTVTKNSNHLRDFIEQSIRSNDQVPSDVLEGFLTWEAPKFPISGKDLIESNIVPRGKLVGLCLNKLKEIWIDGDFTADADHLLKVELPKVAEQLQQNSPQKNKK